MKKRLLSLLLALCMVLSVAPMAVFAEEEKLTIYFNNTAEWEAVYAYFWHEDDSNLNMRPSLTPNPFAETEGAGDIVLGEVMTFVEDSIWSIDVPADTNRIIFNNGGTDQTEELTIPTDGKDLYTPNQGWTVYGCPIKILEQPVGAPTAIGEVYQVSVTAEGEGLQYQWYLKNDGDQQWYESAVRSRIYKGTMTNARANREVCCVITDVHGNMVISEIAKLELKPTELKILEQPQNDEAKNKENFLVTVKAQGDGLTYQWYLKNSGATEWSPSAVKSATYKGVMSDAIAGRQLYCVITDRYGKTVTTNEVTLKREKTELKIVTQPVDDEVALKETYNTFVVAEGDGLTYQWYLQNAGDDENVWHESAVKTKNYRGTMTKARADRKVYCVITDIYGNSVQTETVTLFCSND